MATDEDLLQQWMPQVCYDSLEAFFADHQLQMLVNPGNTLRRAPRGGRDGELSTRWRTSSQRNAGAWLSGRRPA